MHKVVQTVPLVVQKLLTFPCRAPHFIHGICLGSNWSVSCFWVVFLENCFSSLSCCIPWCVVLILGPKALYLRNLLGLFYFLYLRVTDESYEDGTCVWRTKTSSYKFWVYFIRRYFFFDCFCNLYIFSLILLLNILKIMDRTWFSKK